jgi:hypothetical protein
MSLLATVLAATEAPAPLILPNWAFAVIAFAVFLALAFVSWSFRDVANRHSDKTSGAKTGDGSHGAGH